VVASVLERSKSWISLEIRTVSDRIDRALLLYVGMKHWQYCGRWAIPLAFSTNGFSMAVQRRIFLSAEWRDLVMCNYSVDEALLRKYVPKGTSLDSYGGKIYLSVVGFRFLSTKLAGVVGVPFHRDFDEVNLRFYVRRKEGGQERRGVVFIAEIVPRLAIAKAARWGYGENYVRLPMGHSIGVDAVEYGFRIDGAWCHAYARGLTEARSAEEGSLEQFITEHYWGYSALNDGGTVEYQVTHVPWQVRVSEDCGFEGDASRLYGPELMEVLRRRPDNAFVADGSAVRVLAGRRID